MNLWDGKLVVDKQQSIERFFDFENSCIYVYIEIINN